MKLISLIDSRHNFESDLINNMAKMYYHHTRLFGSFSCILERDGVELDPVEDLGISEESLQKAEEYYINHKK